MIFLRRLLTGWCNVNALLYIYIFNLPTRRSLSIEVVANSSLVQKCTEQANAVRSACLCLPAVDPLAEFFDISHLADVFQASCREFRIICELEKKRKIFPK